MVKVFELSLYNGTDPRTGFTLKKGNGDLSTFKSFEELFEAFRIQVEHYIKHVVIKDNVQDYSWEEMMPTPLISSMVDDCLERGKELKQGGAVYDFSGGQTGGIANVANSMAAIKKLVFEEGVLTGQEIMDAMKENFQSARSREIQEMLINRAPKFGNDIDYVDSIAKEAFSVHLKGVDKYKSTRWGRGPLGGTWHPSTASVSANVPMGKVVGATPDGREAGRALADVESATHGTDKHGPTAIVKSVAKIEHLYMSGGSLLNIRVTESSFK
jgi:formate C-acetyltransferase